MSELAVTTRSRRVLVVDDFRDSADVTCTLLRLMGHDSCAAYTGQAALASVAEFQPEIVILDLGLPDLSGFEVAGALRKGGYRLFIAAVSGWGQPEDRRRALAAGCDLHVTKPTDRSKLQQIFDIVDGIRA